MRITHVQGYDWDAIYIDDEIYDQAHSICNSVWQDLVRKAFSVLGGTLDVVDDVDEVWLVENGGYPDSLKDLKRKKK